MWKNLPRPSFMPARPQFRAPRNMLTDARQSPGTPPRDPAETVLRGGGAVVHLVEQFAVPSTHSILAGRVSTPHSGVRGSSS